MSGNAGQSAYTWAPEPSPVKARKGAGKADGKGKGKKSKGGSGGKGVYRQDDAPAAGAEAVNIMCDKRVYRGSTYSSHSKAAAEEQAKEMRRRQAALQQREQAKKARRAAEKEEAKEAAARGAFDARQCNVADMEVQTDTYLEELTDRMPETTTETQTEAFMDRPALPLFVPTKTGVDTETQVDVDELFDFDAEVEPILEVLVGKTLEHAMMEVLEEEELACIRAHQEDFEQVRNVERARVQRLEAEAIRRNQEKARRVDQEQKRLKREADVMEKVAARAFASDYLSDLNSNVFDKLMDSGQLYDPVVKEVESDFLPWLVNSVRKTADERLLSRQMTDSIVERTLERAKEMIVKRQQQLEEKKQQALREREEEEARLKAENEQPPPEEEGEDGEQGAGEGGVDDGQGEAKD